MVITCSLCNGDTKEEYLTSPSCLLYNKQKYSIRHCNNCGIAFTHPAVKLVTDYFNPLDNHKPGLSLLVNFIRYYTVYRWILYSCHKKGKILDFGCGNGEFVSYLLKKGWRAYGVDPKIKAAFTIRSSSYEGFILPSLNYLRENDKGTFDAVILNFSLEHCDNPLSTLKSLYGLLSPKGLIFIRVPNFNHILKNERFSSFQLKIPLHQYFFTTESLTKLLENANFTILKICTPLCLTSMLTPPCSIFSKLDPIDWLYEKMTIVKIIKAASLFFLSLLFLPYTILKSRKKGGVIMYAIAQAPAR
jgi:SAM-dependent methyltransferase